MLINQTLIVVSLSSSIVKVSQSAMPTTFPRRVSCSFLMGDRRWNIPGAKGGRIVVLLDLAEEAERGFFLVIPGFEFCNKFIFCVEIQFLR